MLVIKQKGTDLLKKIPRSGKNHALDIAFEKLDDREQKELLSLLDELTSNFQNQI